MTWNKKHEEFALSVNLSGSQTLILSDILRKSKLHEPSEIEVDVRKTNRRIGKYRILGEFHRKTICNAIPALEEKTEGMITILTRYNPYVYKILVRPLALSARTQSAKCADTPKVPTLDPMYDGDRKKRSRELLLQNISRLDSLFKKLGMKYTTDALMRIWRMAGKKMSQVEDAVKYMLKVHAQKLEQSQLTDENPKGIFKAKGWLHDCIKYGWHLMDENVELPYLENGEYIVTFVDSLCGRNLDTGQRLAT